MDTDSEAIGERETLKEISQNTANEEQEPAELIDTNKMPKSVLYIVGNEFCERFSFYGMKTILPIYLTSSLGFSENRSTTIIHAFNFFAYFFTVFGGILSDSLWGKYRTILYLSLVYCLGMGVLAGSSFPSWQSIGSFTLGLVLVAFGTGGIKPCVSAFGGDQFDSRQVQTITLFFSIFYFSINAGSVLSMFVTPILRQNVHCFGEKSCYPLAFGLPAVLMLVATCVFVAGSHLYIKNPPTGNTFVRVIQVVNSSILNRFRRRNNEARSLLDYADPSEFTPRFLVEVKIVLGIVLVFLPVSLFWALYDQQSSRWTYQAIMMNHQLGSVRIKPEQMGVFNAILILLLIPAFERVIYPTLDKAGVSIRPLARMFWGMSLAVVSFLMAAMLQFVIEARGTFIENPDDHITRLCSDGCVHVLWQVPQYFALTCGEVMLSITGLEFAYSQAPASMKGFFSAVWLLAVAIGNLVVIVLNEVDPVSWITSNHSMAWNFVLWASVLATGTLVFSVIAADYKFVNLEELHSIAEPDEELIIEESNKQVE